MLVVIQLESSTCHLCYLHCLLMHQNPEWCDILVPGCPEILAVKQMLLLLCLSCYIVFFLVYVMYIFLAFNALALLFICAF